MGGEETLPYAIGSMYLSYNSAINRIYYGDGSGYDLRFSKRGAGATTDFVTFKDTGNVGIGTTSPGALLEISSSTAASLLNVKGAGNNGLLFVSGSGAVGIGTTNPVNTLSVYGEASLRLDNTFYWNGYYNAGYKAIAAGYASYINTWSTGDVVIANINISASSAGSSITFRERYRINKDGVHTWEYVNNVAGTAMTLNGTGLGIGTTSPTARLHVSGSTDGIFEVDTAGGVT